MSLLINFTKIKTATFLKDIILKTDLLFQTQKKDHNH